MKYLRIVVHVILVLLIGLFSLYSYNTKEIATSLATKSLETEEFLEVDKRVFNEESSEKVETSIENSVVEKESEIVESPKVDVSSSVPVEEIVPQVQETQPVSSGLEVQTGAISSYGPDCVGCSGTLASGFYAGNGNIYYQDSTYGSVRIVAGDRSYPFGTIVKVSGTPLGDFNAIVLDRGGGIGFGKRFLFDLLFPSEAEGFGSYWNITFTILRYGY